MHTMEDVAFEESINVETVNKYFELLERKNAIITVCVMMSDQTVPGFGCKNIRVSEWTDLVEEVLRLGYKLETLSLHTTLNQTNLAGRKREHIQSARILCVDIDTPITEETVTASQVMHKPHWIVQSSPGKYHFYWKIFPGIPLERWQVFQAGLAHIMGGDLNLSVPTAMIRVPGFTRKTKSGEFFCPNIIYAKPSGALTDAGILAQWPDILEQGRVGLETLKEARIAAGAAARKAWEQREDWDLRIGKTNGCFKAIKGIGRNVTLYFACKEEFKKKEYTEDAAQEFGEFVNSHFDIPLDAHECSRTVVSAYGKASRYWQKRKNIVECFGSQPSIDSCNDTAQEQDESVKRHPPEGEANLPATPSGILLSAPKPKAKKSRARDKETESAQGAPVAGAQPIASAADKAAADRGTSTAAGESSRKSRKKAESPEIPAFLLAAAKRLSKGIWDSDREASCKALVAALTAKNFVGYAQHQCRAFAELIGAFRTSGPVVHLKTKNRWGKAVRYGKPIDRESFKALMSTAVSEFALMCVRDEEFKAALGDMALREMPKQHSLSVIEDVIWKCALLVEKQCRQPDNLVVFQNGVLDLDKGIYEPMELAPIEYSHPLWCEFDGEIWNKGSMVDWKDIEAWKDWFVLVCPVTAKYFNDWMPDDAGAWILVLRYFGCAMTTDSSEQKFMFLFGPTRAGKGSICRTFSGLVGDGNYTSGDYSMLGGGFKTAEIADKLLVTFEEVEGTEKEHNVRFGFLKKLLGGERVMFERKYGQPFEDSVIAKFVLQSNEPLLYQDKGNAVRARMLALGLEHSFEEMEGRDPSIVILEAEANQLATVAAQAWYRARRTGKGIFKLTDSEGDAVSCRAVHVGKKEVVEKLDILTEVINKYLVVHPQEDITCAGLSDLLKLISEERGLINRSRAKLDEADWMHRGMKNIKASRSLNGLKREQTRGWQGIGLDVEKFLEDYPNLDPRVPGHENSYSGLIIELERRLSKNGVEIDELL